MPMTLKQFLEKLPIRRQELPSVQCCVTCKGPLQEAVTGNRSTDKGHVCSDCYFQEFGKELDQYPIFMPRSIRGV